MRKRVLFVVVMWLAAISLYGCENGTAQQTTESIDYNQFLCSHGWVAIMEESSVFLNQNHLSVLSYAEPDVCISLCANAICSHRTEDCTANLQTNGIFASGDYIYYIAQDNQGLMALFQMNETGTMRRKVKELPLLDQNIGFSVRIYGNYLVLETNILVENQSESAIYITTLEKDSPCKCIFRGEDESTIYTAPEIKDGWLFVEELRGTSRTLVGYELSSGQTIDVVKDWNPLSAYSLMEDVLIWCVPGDGIYTVEMSSLERNCVRKFDPIIEYGPVAIDDKYVYLLNSLDQLDSLGVQTEMRGLFIYDVNGRQMQFIPCADKTANQLFLFANEENVFFYDATKSQLLPSSYLSKSSISDGIAKWILLE